MFKKYMKRNEDIGKKLKKVGKDYELVGSKGSAEIQDFDSH